MKDLKMRGTEAAIRFLAHRGYGILEAGWQGASGACDIVATDEGELVLVDVQLRGSAERGFPSEACSKAARASREAVAIEYLAAHPDLVDKPVRFDNLAILVIGDDRAFVRHHINALSVEAAYQESALPEAA